MASLSLPRVLQLKKNSLDAEREQFEKFQTLAIQKAINAIETPVKEKHVRSTIIGTFQEQSAITYWMVAIRLPLQDNRIVSWKFCHVTHKLLREGHPACLDDSQRHISMIENLGKLWVHLREGYGKLVHLYCNLLVCKLKFHARNPRFPGNMQLTADELDAIAENDVNNYFQLCVELFDYMDDILTLQAAVFDSLGNARANSMTASGQCRLAALIPCAQDASQIYDCNVRLLFRLHASLPPDTLQGHRERFRQQFKKLSSFYKHASSLQYYRNLLTLPVLPTNPPNFLLQSDFGTYVTPVVSIPEQSEPLDEIDSVASLIDTSDTMSQMSQEQIEESFERPAPSPQPDPIMERDRLIDHLQNELKRMRSEVSQLVQERNNMLGSMREHCSRLESQLQTAHVELHEEKQKADILLLQTPEIKQKLTETEEKAKIQDEKFQKLKGAYTQLREEHISLIRQKAEVDKLSASLRAAAAQHESAKVQLQQQLEDRMKDVELLQQSASSSEEIEQYHNQIAELRNELEKSREKELTLATVKASLEALEIEHQTTKTEHEDKINTISNELKEATESLEATRKEKEERETELNRVKEELLGLREKSGDEYKKVAEERDTALKHVVVMTQQHLQEKEELTKEMRDSVEKLQAEIDSLQQNLVDTESNYAMECERLNADLSEKYKELDTNLAEKDSELNEARDKLTQLEKELENTKEIYENKLKDLVSQKDNEISTLKEEIKIILDQNNNEITKLQKILDETSQSGELQKSERIELSLKVNKLETTLHEKSKELEDLELKISELTSELETLKVERENDNKDNKHQIELLENKLHTVTESKDEIINNFKIMIAEKDNQVISLNVEMTKLSEEVSRLSEQLNETQAELEIGNNELIELKEEHENIIRIRDRNLSIKNQELRDLHDKINSLVSTQESVDQLKTEKDQITLEKEELKQVLETKISEIQEDYTKLTTEYETYKSEHEKLSIQLNDELNNLKTSYDQIINEKDDEIKTLKELAQNLKVNLKDQVGTKDEVISQIEIKYEGLRTELDELQKLKAKEKEDMELIISEKDSEKQMLEARLSHVQTEKLSAECELQDLLQHNTALEADLKAARMQLEEAQRRIDEQSTKLVTSTGQAAVEMVNSALVALERSNAQESNKVAADLAAKAMEDLERYTEIKGNEENIAKSAVTVAHNAAQLSAYVTEVSHISTDMDASDKLTSDCRSMLTSSRDYLEALAKGSLTSSASVRSLLRRVAQAAVAADGTGAACSVDDELADMDMAIEQAATKIEEMLAASRAGDSGVKLEVNEKILDACTTLMAAVRILVQESRRLQNELGDPTTRQNMYRKNPQWSEGLISAAKAVVFAAKLLVSSADDVVGSGARVECVSAAAHEVAAATAQLVAASRARAPPAAPALASLTHASRDVAAAVGALVAAVRAAAARHRDAEALDTSALTLTATRILEMESKVRSLELESELEAERARLAALRKRHYQLAQAEENGNVTNGKE